MKSSSPTRHVLRLHLAQERLRTQSPTPPQIAPRRLHGVGAFASPRERSGAIDPIGAGGAGGGFLGPPGGTAALSFQEGFEAQAKGRSSGVAMGAQELGGWISEVCFLGVLPEECGREFSWLLNSPFYGSAIFLSCQNHRAAVGMLP